MHELGIAQNILEIIQNAVPDEQKAAVRKIHIRVGQLSGVVPDSLDFCFSVILNESRMPKARLAIEQMPTITQCRDCGNRFQIKDLVFVCPSCKNTNLELVSGKELEIVEIELADDHDEAT